MVLTLGETTIEKLFDELFQVNVFNPKTESVVDFPEQKLVVPLKDKATLVPTTTFT